MMILGEAFWGRALSGKTQPPAPIELDALVSLELVAATALESPPPFGEELERVPDQTSWLTASLREWAHELGWSPFREIRLPLAGDERESGRLDLVIFRPAMPELVIELDSKNDPRSVAKLERARDLGALAVWIRWNAGGTREIPGVHVLDLTRLVRADAA